MQVFIGTKRVMAFPMTRLEYNAYRGWELPANEDGSDAGYLVEYADGGKPNDHRHLGYISWSPKEQFDNAYRPTNRMTFGDALVMLKAGRTVSREGWNGKRMWLALTPGRTVEAEAFWSKPNRKFAESAGGAADMQPYITMKTAQNMIVPWVASQSDMLAEDWALVG